jgi:hypothetical protein
MNGLRGRGNMLNDSPMRGARRSGPCITGGVSPSLRHARQSVTGPIFTGPTLAHLTVLQWGFVEPKPVRWAGSASSGPAQSQDQTKAGRRAPLNFPLPPLLSLSRWERRSNLSAAPRRGMNDPSPCPLPRGERDNAPGIRSLPSLSPGEEGFRQPVGQGLDLPSLSPGGEGRVRGPSLAVEARP